MNAVVQSPQWADFRSYVAHLLREAENLSTFQSQTEQLLRNTFGYTWLRSQSDSRARQQAATLLQVTSEYSRMLAQRMDTVAFADSTGFDPEGVRRAMMGLRGMSQNLTPTDWQPSSLFGTGPSLSNLIGVMMQVPNLRQPLEELGGSGRDRSRIAEIAKSWVAGRPWQQIANAYFEGADATERLSEACKGIYRALVNSTVWGLAALSKLPGSGINWESLSNDDRRTINLLPAFLYHGVDSEEAVMLRMNAVPRAIAKPMGDKMRNVLGSAHSIQLSDVRAYLRNLDTSEWEAARPSGASMTGSGYREVWKILAGE
jgi:hypothetical protein